MNEFIHHVSDATFELKVLKSDVPCWWTSWAEWCGPCKAIAPVLDEVARSTRASSRSPRSTVDENQEIPKKYGIRGYRRSCFSRTANVEAQKVGSLSKSQLTAFLDSNI